MRLHTNDLTTRVLGTLTGSGFLLIGFYATFGVDDGGVSEAVRDLAPSPPDAPAKNVPSV